MIKSNAFKQTGHEGCVGTGTGWEVLPHRSWTVMHRTELTVKVKVSGSKCLGAQVSCAIKFMAVKPQERENEAQHSLALSELRG